MNTEEKHSVSSLLNHIAKTYREVLNYPIKSNYKNIPCSILAKKRRQSTAILRLAGEKEFKGCIYGKKNVKRVKNSNLVDLCNILTPKLRKPEGDEFVSKGDFSSDYVKIIKYIFDCFTSQEVEDKDIGYIYNFLIPLLSNDNNTYYLESLDNECLKTNLNHHGYFPEEWDCISNARLLKPLIGIEIELYHRNADIFNQHSNFFYFQKDGSLNCFEGGIELTTYPLSAEELLKDGGVIDLLCYKFFPKFGCYSKIKAETGLHVHVSKLTDSSSNLILLQKAFYCFSYEFIKIVFGRDNNGYCSPIERILNLKELGIHPSAADYEGQKKIFNCIPTYDRYKELNFTNNETIEFRRGKGTVNPEAIKLIIDFCYTIYNFCLENEEISTLDLKRIKEEVIYYFKKNAYTSSLKQIISQYAN